MSRRIPAKDPNAPKRNQSAYLLYQNAMRETFRCHNPGMTFGELSKYTSSMYRELSAEEKEAWLARAEADKARYLHELSNYVPPPGYDLKGDLITHPSGLVPGKGPKEKDPAAPKRNMSAYLLYQNAMRDTFKAENPGMTFGQLAKYTSAMYKSLTKEEKVRWENYATQDKQRYEEELANYVPAPGYDATGNSINPHVGGKKYKKAYKDPNAPKRARGSFVFFTFEARPKIMKERPGIKFADMGTLMGERWRALSAQEKAKYEDMAQEDKKRFNEEMQVYQASLAAKNPPAVARPEVAAPYHHYPPQPPPHHPQPEAHAHYPEQYYQGHHVDPNADQQGYADYYAQHGQHYDPQTYQYPPPPE